MATLVNMRTEHFILYVYIYSIEYNFFIQFTVKYYKMEQSNQNNYSGVNISGGNMIVIPINENGLLTGEYAYFVNGALKILIEYREGLAHGRYLEIVGRYKVKGFYVNGIKCGDCTKFKNNEQIYN